MLQRYQAQSITPPALPAQLVALHLVVEHLHWLALPALHAVRTRIRRIFLRWLRSSAVFEHPSVADAAVLVLLESHCGVFPATTEKVPKATILLSGVDLRNSDSFIFVVAGDLLQLIEMLAPMVVILV